MFISLSCLALMDVSLLFSCVVTQANFAQMLSVFISILSAQWTWEMNASEISVTGDNVFERRVLNTGPSGLHVRPTIHRLQKPNQLLSTLKMKAYECETIEKLVNRTTASVKHQQIKKIYFLNKKNIYLFTFSLICLQKIYIYKCLFV